MVKAEDRSTYPTRPSYLYWFSPRARRIQSDSELIMAHHARTFDFAAQFLPPEKRAPVATLYAFCRLLDDAVDERGPGWDRSAVQDQLDGWRHWLRSDHIAPGPAEPMATQLAQVITEYQLPVGYLLDLIDGLESDLHGQEIVDDADLHLYCYQVASTVGLTMAHVLGATSRAALAAAAEVGIAMQLTNILRDVGGDLSARRVYLPNNLLERHSLTHEDLYGLHRAGRGPDDRLRNLMQEQVERAHQYYARGAAGIWLLPPDCRLPILVATRLYRRILTVIEANHYDTLRQRAATSSGTKLREFGMAFVINSLWRHGEHPRSVATAPPLAQARLAPAWLRGQPVASGGGLEPAFLMMPTGDAAIETPDAVVRG